MKKQVLVAAMTLVLAVGCTWMTGCGSDTSQTEASGIAAAADEPFAQEMTKTLAYDENLNDPDTFFRDGGSAAEHKTADYLAEQYEKIGLQEVTKEEVTIDGWETGESYMKVGDIDVQDLVSYQATGTHGPDGKAYPVSISGQNTGSTSPIRKPSIMEPQL